MGVAATSAKPRFERLLGQRPDTLQGGNQTGLIQVPVALDAGFDSPDQ
jgi:hypothetical protein